MRTNILHIDIAAPVDISDIVTFIIRSQVQNERLHELVLMAAYPLTFQVHDWSVSLWFPTGFKISAVDTDPVKPVQDLCSVGQELVVLNADFLEKKEKERARMFTLSGKMRLIHSSLTD